MTATLIAIALVVAILTLLIWHWIGTHNWHKE